MRTTVAIDDDVLNAAKAIARQRNQSLGKVLSELARSALPHIKASAERNGVLLLPVLNPNRAATLELVNALRDEAP